jgi:cellulose synthase/poly-beta-1,6-N-acetylglucosamine synthase-like glycosyltransferase
MEMSNELTKSDILKYLDLINEKLIEQNQHGEINICGGAAMALVYDARDATYDIDALYMPKDVISKIVAQIAEECRLDTHWLNDDFTMFTSGITELTSSTKRPSYDLDDA